MRGQIDKIIETDEYTLSDQQKLLQRYKRVGGNKGQR